MANEPKYNLRQVTARIDLEDYGKVIQFVDTKKNEDGTPIFKDVSSLVRDAIHAYVAPMQLDEQHKEWVESQRQLNVSKRTTKREKHCWLRRKVDMLFR